MLEEMEFQKQKVVDEDHVANLINGEDQHEPQEELPECKAASESVPDGDHTHPEDHQNADDKQCPSDCPGTVEEFVFFLGDHFPRYEMIILRKIRMHQLVLVLTRYHH